MDDVRYFSGCKGSSLGDLQKLLFHLVGLPVVRDLASSMESILHRHGLYLYHSFSTLFLTPAEKREAKLL